MLNSTFLKDLYSRRWSTLAWSIGVTVVLLITISIFHTLENSFQQAVQTLPVSLRGLVGDAASFTTINGYVNQQVFIKTMSIFGTVFVVLLFSGALAGEEGNGKLQVLLAQPISRTRVALEKFAAAAIVWLGLCAAVFLASSVGSLLIGEHLHYKGLVAVTFSLWLLGLTIGGFTYMMGAILGRRGVAGGIAGIVVFGLFILDSLAAGIQSLAAWSKISPFHYYTRGDYDIILRGLRLPYILLHIGLITLWLIVTVIWFNRRDIYQR